MFFLHLNIEAFHIHIRRKMEQGSILYSLTKKWYLLYHPLDGSFYASKGRQNVLEVKSPGSNNLFLSWRYFICTEQVKLIPSFQPYTNTTNCPREHFTVLPQQ